MLNLQFLWLGWKAWRRKRSIPTFKWFTQPRPKPASEKNSWGSNSDRQIASRQILRRNFVILKLYTIFFNIVHNISIAHCFSVLDKCSNEKKMLLNYTLTNLSTFKGIFDKQIINLTFIHKPRQKYLRSKFVNIICFRLQSLLVGFSSLSSFSPRSRNLKGPTKNTGPLLKGL